MINQCFENFCEYFVSIWWVLYLADVINTQKAVNVNLPGTKLLGLATFRVLGL